MLTLRDVVLGALLGFKEFHGSIEPTGGNEVGNPDAIRVRGPEIVDDPPRIPEPTAGAEGVNKDADAAINELPAMAKF